MQKIFSILSIAALTASCASAPPPAPITEAHYQARDSAVRPSAKAEVAEGIRWKLRETRVFKDPESLTIEPVSAVRAINGKDKEGNIWAGYSAQDYNAGWFVCAYYNAKNAMGGYTGEKVLVAYLDPEDPTQVMDIDFPYTSSLYAELECPTMKEVSEVVDLKRDADF